MIRAIITDFDGTLVDTFDANLKAYQKAFGEVGVVLSEEKYRECFGFRFDRFMEVMGISEKEITVRIKSLKKDYYPLFFESLHPNDALIELIRSFKCFGGKTAIASTARKENLMNALDEMHVNDNNTRKDWNALSQYRASKFIGSTIKHSWIKVLELS